MGRVPAGGGRGGRRGGGPGRGGGNGWGGRRRLDRSGGGGGPGGGAALETAGRVWGVLQQVVGTIAPRGGHGLDRGLDPRLQLDATGPSTTGNAPQPESVESLRAEARRLEARLDDLRARIAAAERAPALPALPVASVAAPECTACGECVEACPVEAITLDQVAVVDEPSCLACGACVAVCPAEAIALVVRAPDSVEEQRL